uniref:Putative portal protein n=2 Tax=viral metagenome TaxID=1070528 RepID=A0A6M3IH02_9ZZZZ
MAMPRKIGEKPDLRMMRQWVYDAKIAQAEWRAEVWRDYEMWDGGRAQWTQKDWDAAKAAGIDPITINRIFPVLNLVRGSEAINKFDIQVKGRTHKDSEIGQIMTEGIHYIMDVCDGEWICSDAFGEQVTGGLGWIGPCLHPDPRREKLRLVQRDWKEVWWDPFSSPWINPLTTRYVFMQRWIDLDAVQAAFPEKAQELDEHFHALIDELDREYYDEAQLVEDHKSMLMSTRWADKTRRRIRPVEMWYTMREKAWFASLPNGRIVEINRDMDGTKLREVLNASQEVIGAIVPKVYVKTFIGDLELEDSANPYNHDQFPFVPFVGYCDRFKQPFGIPRQIRGQNEEINKRRSMILAMLKARQVITERDVVDGGQPAMQGLWEEANKLDGFLVVEAGKLDKIKIVEQNELYRPQMDVMLQSEQEINEISGSNEESRGIQSNATSGVAMEARAQRSTIMLAPLFDNYRRSKKLLGEQLSSNMSQFWTGPKVLRITDRLTGAEKWVEINQPIVGPSGLIEVKNNISEIGYDCVVSEAPATSTVREQWLNMLIETMKKSPPELIPHLWMMGLEISNLPNKEQLVERMRPILGIEPFMDEKPEDAKQKAIQALEAQREQQAKEAQRNEAMADLMTAEQDMKVKLLQAQIEKTLSDARANRAKVVGDIKAKEQELKISRAKAVKELKAPPAEVIPISSRQTEKMQKNMQKGARV